MFGSYPLARGSRALWRSAWPMGLALIAAAVLILSTAHPANANFRGSNGLIAFDTARDGDTEIYAYAPDGTFTNLSNDPAYDDRAPRWSPDGARITFFKHLPDDRQTSEIWIMDADGSNQTQLTDGNRAEVPAFLSDGRIVFSRQADDGSWHTWIMNPDGSGLVQVTAGSDAELWPSPAPHGTRIAYSAAYSGSMQIYTMKADGSNVHQVTWAPGNAYQSDWSPSGNTIVYRSEVEGDRTELFVSHLDGTGIRQLTDSPDVTETFPSWAPDGTMLVYAGESEGGIGIYAYDLAAGESTLIIPDAGYPSWQPVLAR